MLSFPMPRLAAPEIACRRRATTQVQSARRSGLTGQGSVAVDLGTYGTNATGIRGGRPTSSPDRWTG